ncbi:hypothetical protein Kallioja_00006 [Pseudomonas phage vB_PpuP-Kallioja]
MSNRKEFASIINGETGRVAKLYHIAEFEEYEVEFFEGLAKSSKATYFTRCRTEALNFAVDWAHKKD